MRSNSLPAHLRSGRYLPAMALAVLLLIGGAAGAEDPGLGSPIVSTLAGPFDSGVGGVTVDALGFIYVADFGQKVWKISPWGEVEVFVETLYGTSGNAVDPQGNLLQSSFNAGTLSRVARDGTITTLAEGLAGPVGVTVNSDEKIYVTNCSSNVISRVSAAGEVSDFASGSLFNCPNGLSHDAEGNLYVANFADGRVIKISPAGEAALLATIPGGSNGHVVAVGSDLYVTAFRANMIFKVSAEGEVRPFAGTGAFGQQDGPVAQATFSTPNGIAYNPARDALYVNDRLETWTERWEGRARPRSSVREILFPTLEETTRAGFAAGRPEAGKKALAAFVASHPGRPYVFVLNAFGYRLLQAGEVGEATAVFELNTELFPQAFNVWDSLGEAHKAAGRKRQAIQHYRKSLELNPANANATKMLKELGAD